MLLLAALIGAAAMSANAGVRFGVSIGFPLPVVVSPPVIYAAPRSGTGDRGANHPALPRRRLCLGTGLLVVLPDRPGLGTRRLALSSGPGRVWIRPVRRTRS